MDECILDGFRAVLEEERADWEENIQHKSNRRVRREPQAVNKVTEPVNAEALHWQR